MNSDAPPSYEEATSGVLAADEALPNENQSPSSSLQTYGELAAALRDLNVSTFPQNAEILYELEHVQLYYISPDGSVTSDPVQHTLRIFQLEDGGKENRPDGVLQVGEWIYPLVTGVSPCFRAEYGAFIFPDLHSLLQGSSVGIIIPKDAGESAYEILSDIIRGILKEPSILETEKQRRGEGYSSSISRGLIKGAQYVSKGLVMGAEKASVFMNDNTPKVIQHFNAADGNPSYVHPNISRSVQVAKDVSCKAVHVTGYIAGKVSGATMALGQYLAPHIQRQGARLLSSSTRLNEQEAEQKMGDILQLAAGAVEGFGTVYAGLENSASILGTSLANNTVMIVEHKFGHPAAQVTGDTLSTVGNVFTAGSHMKCLTPKGLAKSTAKSAGKAVVEDYRVALRSSHEESTEHGTASDLVVKCHKQD